MNELREVIAVKPMDDFILLVTFDNGEKKLKDMKPYLDKGVFRKLKDPGFFRSVHVNRGVVEWPGEIDLCPDALYETSIPMS